MLVLPVFVSMPMSMPIRMSMPVMLVYAYAYYVYALYAYAYAHANTCVYANLCIVCLCPPMPMATHIIHVPTCMRLLRLCMSAHVYAYAVKCEDSKGQRQDAWGLLM